MSEIVLPIETKRLILRDFTMSDVPDFLEMVERSLKQVETDPDYRIFFWFRPKDGQTQEENIRARIAASIEKSKESPRVNYSLAVQLRDNDKLIGRFAIDMDGIGDTGTFIDPLYQRHGYQSEARIAMMDLYFERFPALTATADPKNKPSNVNLISFGAVLEETTKGSDYDGEPRNVYKITKESYEKARAEKLKRLQR